MKIKLSISIVQIQSIHLQSSLQLKQSLKLKRISPKILQRISKESRKEARITFNEKN